MDPGGLDPDMFGPGKADPYEDFGAFRAQDITSLAAKISAHQPTQRRRLPEKPVLERRLHVGPLAGVGVRAAQSVPGHGPVQRRSRSGGGASRLVPHGQWYENEQLATLEDTFKKSVLKRGCPDKVYVDRCALYRSAEFAFALAQFNIRLRRSKPYQSEGRGVIERFNRTVADQFEPEVRAARIAELDRLNLLWEGWLEERYHRETHDATGQAPLDRFAQDGFTPRWADPTLVTDTFRVRVSRKVHPKTSTVQIEGVGFLVESFLRGRWVWVYFDPHLSYANIIRIG